MVPPGRGFRQEFRSSQRNPAASNRSENSRLSRQSSQSLHERRHQESGAAASGSTADQQPAGGSDRRQSGFNKEAAFSAHHADLSALVNNGKYNCNNVSHPTSDVNQADLSEETICKIDNCNRTFISELALKTHQGKAHHMKTGRVCDLCSARFARLTDLTKHVRCSHKLYDLVNLLVQLYYSTWCCR